MRHTTYIAGLVLVGLAAIKSSIAAENTHEPSSFDKTIESSPVDPKNYLDRGAAYFRKNDWDKAINDFSAAIRYDPKNALAYEFRGACYFLKSDLEKAIDDFNRAIQLNPTNAATFSNRGGAYRVARQFDKALSDFDESLRLNPTNDIVYKTRAAVHSAKGELAKAIKDWNEGLRLNQKDANAIACRGRDYFYSGEFQKALEDYKAALEIDPTNSIAYNNLGWLRATCPIAELRDGKAAIEAATKGCQLTKWSKWDGVDTLAAAFAEDGNFEKAIDYQKQAIKIHGLNDQDQIEMRARLSLYERKQPFRELSLVPPN